MKKLNWIRRTQGRNLTSEACQKHVKSAHCMHTGPSLRIVTSTCCYSGSDVSKNSAYATLLWQRTLRESSSWTEVMLLDKMTDMRAFRTSSTQKQPFWRIFFNSSLTLFWPRGHMTIPWWPHVPTRSRVLRVWCPPPTRLSHDLFPMDWHPHPHTAALRLHKLVSTGLNCALCVIWCFNVRDSTPVTRPPSSGLPPPLVWPGLHHRQGDPWLCREVLCCMVAAFRRMQ